MEDVNMNMEEFRCFFSKYNTSELESISRMFKITYGNEMKPILNILEEEYQKQENRSTVVDKNFKIKLMNEKELSFFYNLIYNTLISLSCVKDPRYEEEVNKSSRLLTKVEYELDERNNKRKILKKN